MKLKTLFTSVIVLLLSANALWAQSETKKDNRKLFSNTVRVSYGYFHIPDKFIAYPNQIGIHYERKVYKNVYAGLGYACWRTPAQSWKATPFVEEQPLSFEIGALWSRMAYQMVDAYVHYKYRPGNRKHVINAGIGASYNWGINKYLGSFYVNPEPPGDIVAYPYWEKVHYWSMSPGVNYDYLLFRNRLAVGLGLRARIYPGKLPTQLDYGVHAAVNF